MEVHNGGIRESDCLVAWGNHPRGDSWVFEERPGEVVGSPALEVFKTQMGKVLCSLV